MWLNCNHRTDFPEIRKSVSRYCIRTVNTGIYGEKKLRCADLALHALNLCEVKNKIWLR